jgi:hypothetical protein
MAQQTGTAPDPLAQLGTPATPSAPAADPLAAIGTPATPPPAAAATQSSDNLTGRIVEGARQFAAPIANLVASAVKPPESSTEQIIHGVTGPGGLIAYRQARNLINAAKNVVEAGPEAYENAVKDYKQAHDDFVNEDYRGAASSAASLATDAAGIVDPTAASAARDARELTEGARPGANLATPLTRQILTAGGALAGGAAASGEDAAAGAAETPRALRRLIVNPFRKLTATPTAAGEAAETEAATAGVKSVLGSKGTGTMALGMDVETPYTAAKNLYRTVDKAAGTNFDSLYTQLANAQDRVMEELDGSVGEAKALADVKTQEDQIAQAKQRAAAAGVKNVDQVLAQADAKFTEAQANKEFNFKFKDAMNGDIRPGAQPTVDVDKALSIAKKMTQPTIKYPTPRLYQTTIGKAGANTLLDNLLAAKKAGEKAVELRTIRNWTLGAAATAGTAAYELAK